MNIYYVKIPRNFEASIDTKRMRTEVHINTEEDHTIVAYYPVESLQVYVYKVNGNDLPDMWDLGIRKAISDKYLRILICKRCRRQVSCYGRQDCSLRSDAS